MVHFKSFCSKPILLTIGGVFAVAVALTCALAVAPHTAAADSLEPTSSPDLQAESTVAPEATAEATQNMYRLYNMKSGEHFYTASASERDGLVNRGWFYEGTGWVAPAKSDTPVYRLYNPVAGDHHYTTSAVERDKLKRVGWRDEGIGWYSDDQKRVAVYRAYNPNAWTGTHHYTTGANEINQICRLGWRNENVGWYAVEGGKGESWNNLNYNHLRIILDVVGGGSGINTVGCSLSNAQRDRINRFLDSSVGFVAINIKTGKCVARNGNARTFSASTIKAPFVAGLCKYDVGGLRDRWGQIYDVITYSSNEDYNDLYYTYGGWPLEKFVADWGVWLDLPYSTLYADITPRELAKMWLGMREFICSNHKNAALFRSFFGNGAYYKEGWMEPGTWSGTMYHVGGVQGEVVYAIMTRWNRPDPDMWALKDALVAAVS